MVTWQGKPPRSWASASSARRRSPEPAASVFLGESDHGEEEALRDTDGLVEAAEAELTGVAADSVGPEQARVERLREDQLLVEGVLEQGLNGIRHVALEDELIRYAVPILQHLLADGRLVSKAVKLLRPPAPLDAWMHFTGDDREEFAQEMVANVLPGFSKAVFVERRWTPGGGATLKTYFVNACIMRFARIQAQWLRDRQAVRPMGLEFDPDAFAGDPDPAVTVIVRDQVDRLLLKMPDEQLREVMVLRGAGWPAKSAAEQAGLTPKAAESRLARFRKNLEEERAGTNPRASRRSGTAQGGR